MNEYFASAGVTIASHFVIPEVLSEHRKLCLLRTQLSLTVFDARIISTH